MPDTGVHTKRKMPIVVLNSQDRTVSSTSSADCRIPLQNQIHGARTAKLLSFVCPNTMYQVTTGNNSFGLRESSTTATVTLTPGAYSVNTFCTLLQTALTAASPNQRPYTVTYSATTFRITISILLGTFSLQFASGGPYRLMGFAATNTTAAQTITAPYACQFGAPANITLSSPQLASSVNSSSAVESGGAYVVPFDASAGSYCYAETNSTYQQVARVAQRDLSCFDVRVCTLDGPADLNGSDWSMVLDVQ